MNQCAVTNGDGAQMCHRAHMCHITNTHTHIHTNPLVNTNSCLYTHEHELAPLCGLIRSGSQGPVKA